MQKHHFHPRNLVRWLRKRRRRAQIRAEVRRFRSLTRKLKKRADLIVDDSIPDTLVVTPQSILLHRGSTKRIALTFLAIVHGDEIGGAAVLNRLLAEMAGAARSPEIPLAFILGNPAAALKHARYLERDLNRTFGLTTGNLLEERRARVLGDLLKETDFLVDFHQTTEETDRPFFIFPFERRSYDFARAISPRRTIVTHWDEPAAGEHFPSDGFVQRCGGTAITIELGKKGMASAQIKDGVECGLASYRAVIEGFGPGKETGPVYTWSDHLPWPTGDFVDTVRGLRNFLPVKEGAKLAEVDGRAVRAPRDGLVLFPRYLVRRHQATHRPPDLCRILKPIHV